ncbi:hypothetical protein GCM10025868_36720 [Angustibacter aerolatus]|uniref:Uncharacterized protein n=1 Tax=Angustibacter aerolatus TaxID=1162965 RepID=A0ABQ6JJK5_9ACTN|nr:hypothetical protein GCM10025868_36720 [Angustibacter aerolatus]
MPFVGPAPALRLLDAAAQRVHHGVEVGAHPQTEQRDVVAGVADDGDLGLAARGVVGRGEGGQQAAQEAGAADAAGQCGDAHPASVSARPATAGCGRAAPDVGGQGADTPSAGCTRRARPGTDITRRLDGRGMTRV